jgi:hypothetical protein
MTTVSVARNVHFRESNNGPCLAAVVAGVNADGSVNLAYFSEHGGVRQAQGIPEASPEQDEPSAGFWHWPERVG